MAEKSKTDNTLALLETEMQSLLQNLKHSRNVLNILRSKKPDTEKKRRLQRLGLAADDIERLISMEDMSPLSQQLREMREEYNKKFLAAEQLRTLDIDGNVKFSSESFQLTNSAGMYRIKFLNGNPVKKVKELLVSHNYRHFKEDDTWVRRVNLEASRKLNTLVNDLLQIPRPCTPSSADRKSPQATRQAT